MEYIALLLPHPYRLAFSKNNRIPLKRSKAIRRAMRRPVETFFFRLAMLCIPLLPRSLVVLLTNIAGSATYYFAGKERRTGLANLNAVFGSTLTARRKKTILKKSFSSFARTMADIFWFSKKTKQRVKSCQTFVPNRGPYFEDRAQVIITAHSGNWELIGLESGLLGLDVASVAAETKNRAVDQLLNEMRQKTGQTILAQNGALRNLINRFRKGGKAAFVLDQNTRADHGGIWVNFLGLPTPVSPAPALLSYRTGTEIIFAFSHPTHGGKKYEARTGPVIQPPAYDKEKNQDAVILELTQQIMDVLSAHIRSNPESWLWSYKHWLRKAPGTDPALYPIYH